METRSALTTPALYTAPAQPDAGYLEPWRLVQHPQPQHYRAPAKPDAEYSAPAFETPRPIQHPKSEHYRAPAKPGAG